MLRIWQKTESLLKIQLLCRLFFLVVSDLDLVGFLHTICAEDCAKFPLSSIQGEASLKRKDYIRSPV